MRLSILVAMLLTGLPSIAQSVLQPTLLTNLPAGATQRVIGTYSADCQAWAYRNCTTTAGDILYDANLLGNPIDEAGTVFTTKWAPVANNLLVSSWQTELWALAVDGSKRKLLDLPTESLCSVVDAHTVRLTISRISAFGYYRTNKPQKTEGFIIKTERLEGTLAYQVTQATCALPQDIFDFPLITTRSTAALISVELSR